MAGILFYYPHKEDIGHGIRLTVLAKAILALAPEVKIHIFQAGKPQCFLPFPSNTAVYQLPLPFYSSASLSTPVILNKKRTASRTAFMLYLAQKIKPDIFITEFFPFGRRECLHEVLPLLKYFKLTKTKIYASLGIPYFTHSKADLGELLSICSLYDRIYIHCPECLDKDYIAKSIEIEKRISKKDFLSVFDSLKKKIHFTGYVINSDCVRHGVLLKKPYILVNRGGGTTSERIIEYALQASRSFSHYTFLIVNGPGASQQDVVRFKKIVKKNMASNIDFRIFVPELIAYFREAELSIGTAGSSAYELLYLRKKAILIPFVGSFGHWRADQLARAAMLRDYLGSTIIDYGTLSVKVLAGAINKKLSEGAVKEKKIKDDWFQGAGNSARSILEGFSE